MNLYLMNSKSMMEGKQSVLVRGVKIQHVVHSWAKGALY